MTDPRRLFEQEMRSLQDEGMPFAADFPEAARMLDQRAVADRDPYVERIIEGTAFLMARIREEMDSECRRTPKVIWCWTLLLTSK